MATERQIAANRANAKKSTGPQSRGGKRRASQNAFVHGLAGRSPVDPDWIARVEQQACEIVDSTRGKIDLSHARLIALAQQEVLRARSISTAVVTEVLATHVGRPPENDGAAGAVEFEIPLLRVLDRYEGRAVARRNRAIRLAFEGTK